MSAGIFVSVVKIIVGGYVDVFVLLHAQRVPYMWCVLKSECEI